MDEFPSKRLLALKILSTSFRGRFLHDHVMIRRDAGGFVASRLQVEDKPVEDLNASAAASIALYKASHPRG